MHWIGNLIWIGKGADLGFHVVNEMRRDSREGEVVLEVGRHHFVAGIPDQIRQRRGGRALGVAQLRKSEGKRRGVAGMRGSGLPEPLGTLRTVPRPQH